MLPELRLDQHALVEQLQADSAKSDPEKELLAGYGGSRIALRNIPVNGGTVQAMVSDGVYETVRTWANGVLFDLGVRYDTGFRTVRLGASVQNFGPDVTYAKESSPVPLLFRFGIAADLAGPARSRYSPSAISTSSSTQVPMGTGPPTIGYR